MCTFTNITVIVQNLEGLINFSMLWLTLLLIYVANSKQASVVHCINPTVSEQSLNKNFYLQKKKTSVGKKKTNKKKKNQ